MFPQGLGAPWPLAPACVWKACCFTKKALELWHCWILPAAAREQNLRMPSRVVSSIWVYYTHQFGPEDRQSE
jgi:hypothetical protein